MKRGAIDMAEERNLWIRLGAMLRITVEEEAAIFCGDPAQAYATLKRSLSEGRYDFDGESYIPEVSIEDFNRKYRTNYCTEEIGVDL